MSIGPLKDEVERRLPWLLNELGFRITEGTYDYKAMGASLVLESETMRLRFVRDRGPIYAEVASKADPERWFELGDLWRVLHGERPEPHLEAWAMFFRDHLGEFAQALGPKLGETLAVYESARQEREEALKRHQERVRAKRWF